MTKRTSSAGFDSISEFHEAFLDFEKKLDLFEWRVDDVPLWERLRISVYRSVLHSNDLMGERYNYMNKSVVGYIKGSYLWGRNILFNNPFFGDEHEVLVWGHQRRKRLEDGRWWDIYVDPIFDTVGLDYQYIEAAHLLDHHRPAKTENIDYLDLITFSSTIYRKLDWNRDEIHSQTTEKIEREILKRFNTTVDIGRLAYERLTDRQVHLPLYQQLLRRVNPDIALVVLGYSRENFVEACMNEGIPVVELQHGFLGDYHIGYSLPDGISKKHKPDYMFSFGPYWTNNVSIFDNDKVFNVGYHYIENKFEQYEGRSRTDELLFISQPTTGRDLSRFAAEVSSFNEHKHDVVYKLHPEEYGIWEEEYPWLVSSSVDVIDGGTDLYELQSQAGAQVGVYSTALFEGLRFGTPTILFETNGIKKMDNLIAQYEIPVVSTVDGLLAVSHNITEQEIDPRDFFSENPDRNFIDAVETICDKW